MIATLIPDRLGVGLETIVTRLASVRENQILDLEFQLFRVS
jgi:hypothetical protein